MTRLILDIWSDIACPWCFIGKRHLEQALAKFDHADAVDIHWRAFELDPAAPARKEVGAESYAVRIAKKYGVPVAQGQQMIDRVVGAGARAGIAFDYAQIKPGNTFDAHRLLAWAATLGVAPQGALKERFLRGYLCEGAAIGDRETIVGLAGDAGLDRDEARAVLAGDRFAAEVRADERLAQELDIHGVPFFVMAGRLGVSGAQPPDVLAGALAKAWDGVAQELGGGADACGPDGCAI
jgi:predicted DsbA family dithiol-disulfide isomerase